MVSYVFESSGSVPRLVGRLDLREGATYYSEIEFAYHPDWVRGGYALGPGMPLVSGPQVFHSMPGPLSDVGPDGWGRGILRAAADQEGIPLHHYSDYVVHAPDETRQGALRFSPSEGGGGWTGSFGRTPGLHDMGDVLDAADSYQDSRQSPADLRMLIASSAASGGARPKAALRAKDGGLWLAKFPRSEDLWDVHAWEATLLDIAVRAGIRTPAFELHRLDPDRSILVVRRFDREGPRRRGYVSARSMVGGSDGDIDLRPTYVDIARAQRRASAHPDADALELVRRAALNIVANNVDDHPRNHGYLRDRDGWVLSPVFDVTPFPYSQVGMAVGPGSSSSDRSLEDLVDQAEGFGLHPDAVRRAVADVVKAASGWRELAQERLGEEEGLDQMRAAFLRSGTGAESFMRTTFAGADLPHAPSVDGGGGRCEYCGRTLRSSTSRVRGYGRACGRANGRST